MRREAYTYNIKDKLGATGESSFSKKMSFIKTKKNQPPKRVVKVDSKCENSMLKRSSSKRSLNGSPRFRKKSSFSTKNETSGVVNHKPMSAYPKLEMKASDTEDYSDVRTEDEEVKPMMSKSVMKPAGGLWKKVSKNVEEKAEAKPKEDNPMLKDLSSMIMEERYKQEERKEIIGEEWRKISRIFDRWVRRGSRGEGDGDGDGECDGDEKGLVQTLTLLPSRFLLFLFTAISLVTTIVCIYASPHFPDPGKEKT